MDVGALLAGMDCEYSKAGSLRLKEARIIDDEEAVDGREAGRD